MANRNSDVSSPLPHDLKRSGITTEIEDSIFLPDFVVTSMRRPFASASTSLPGSTSVSTTTTYRSGTSTRMSGRCPALPCIISVHSTKTVLSRTHLGFLLHNWSLSATFIGISVLFGIVYRARYEIMSMRQFCSLIIPSCALDLSNPIMPNKRKLCLHVNNSPI